MQVRFLMLTFLYHFDFKTMSVYLPGFKNRIKERGMAQDYLSNENMGQYRGRRGESAIAFQQPCYGILFSALR